MTSILTLPPLSPDEVEKVITRVRKQRVKLYKHDLGSYTLVGGLPIVASTKIKTFATDGKKILVNARYANNLPDLHIRGITIHEANHVGKLHHLRRPSWCHPQLWNIATDYLINGVIKRSRNYGFHFTLPDNLLWDDFYSNCDWGAERIARDMLDKGWKPPPPKGKPPPGGGGEKKDDECTGGGEPGESEPEDNGCGEILDAPECHDDYAGNSSVEEEVKKVRDRVADSALLEKAMGQGKGGTCTEIVDSGGNLASPECIQQFLKKHYSSTRSYRRPNRRFLHKKIYLPSKNKTASILYKVIDSSASMGRLEFESARANTIHFARVLGVEIIRIAYVDTYIHMNPITNTPWYEIDLKNGTGLEALKLNVYGGGGTSFDPIFDYLEETKEDVGALIYFTDGFGSVKMRKPAFPVLWVTTGVAPTFVNEKGRHTAPFGIVKRI